MTYKIAEIEGIGTTFSDKLVATEILTTDDLLTRAATPAGRKALSERTGISETLILRWSNHADMMRISGVGPQFAELLEASGVDTVKELRTRNPENLFQKMKEVNESKNLTKTSPANATIHNWIEQAKQLNPIISY